MAIAVTTTVTELPESRVSVSVEVAAEEIQRSLETQARKLGREMKVPGFRTGKIPPAVVIQRIGREPILDEAVRGRLTDWYMKAVDESGIAPVGDPDVDLGKLPDEGKPLTFSFEVGVRPTATLGTYRDLEVPKREPVADPEVVDDQIDEMRERFARLEVVDRPAENGDFVILDFVGTIDGEPFEGGEGRDQLVEVGAGRLIPGLRGGPRRRRARARRRPSTRRSPTTTPPSTSPASRRSSSSPSRRSSTRTSPSSTTSSPPTPPATTRSRSCVSRSPRSCSSTTRSRSRTSSAPTPWTPPSPTRRSTCPRRSSPRGRRSCWTG